MEEVGLARTRQNEVEDSLHHLQVKVIAGFHHQGGVEGGQEEGLAGRWEAEKVKVSLLWVMRKEW